MSDLSWHHAALALRLLAVDPVGLGGAVLRMRAGPDRDALTGFFRPDAPARRLPLSISDEQLLGGVDLASTLSAGRVVMTRGILAEAPPVILPMAERCTGSLAAKLAAQMDEGRISGLLALDEGIEADEAVPDSIRDRMAFHIMPEGRRPNALNDTPHDGDSTPLDASTAMAELTTLAAQFGIGSMRAPLLAWRAAKAHAVLCGRAELTVSDIEIAATLVYPHRATQQPAEDDADDRPEAQDPQTDQNDATGDREETEPFDTNMLVEAVRALLPEGILQKLGQTGQKRAGAGAGAGKLRKSNRRGRPLPSRPGRIGDGARVDLIATLRAAAPWQPLRRTQSPERAGILIRPSDIRVKRYAQHSDRLLIFSVDASGSAAMARLGEVKGAIELLLADAYASRDHVALISFRGMQAETLLPPTRSLVQTKRQLSAMPGGGGTPLASGLRSAMGLAAQSARQGMTPTIIVLTDGRANITLAGTPGRAEAAQDAQDVAKAIRSQGIDALLIDTANRPQTALKDLGHTLDAQYIALPRADAQRVSAAVGAAVRS